MNKEKIRDKLNELERFKEIKNFVTKLKYGSTSFNIIMYHTPLFTELGNVFSRKFMLSTNEIVEIIDLKIERLNTELKELGVE